MQGHAAGDGVSVRELTEQDLAIGETSSTRITPVGAEHLLQEIADRHGLRPEEVLSRRRTAEVCDARLELYAALRQAGWSYPRIGTFVGRDHSTVMILLKRSGKAGIGSGPDERDGDGR